MTSIPTNPDTRLRRKEAADALVRPVFLSQTRRWLPRRPVAAAHHTPCLEEFRVTRGPICLNWAHSRLSPPRQHTSELDVQHTI